ncbi:MAG: hypothetical protein GY940_23050, partial [bacterium]|nr:hypothetical protein [bacterium]
GLPLQALRDFVRPFDLSHAPLLRVKLMETDEGIHILLVDMHHIISDGVSMGVLRTDFIALYEERILPPIRVQYKDFSQWQNSRSETGTIKNQESYWRDEFAGEIPVLQLPLDYPRPPVQRFEGGGFNFPLSAGDNRGLRAVALETGSTLFMVLLSLTIVLLAKLSGQEDIIIGTPVAGRRHADLEKIIGMFVNTLALRNYPGGRKTIKEFLQEVKERTLNAFENQEYQFEDLVEQLAVARDAGRNPLFDVMFILNEINTGPAAGEAAAAVEEREPRPESPVDNYEDRVAKFDLTISAMETGEELLIGFQYCTKLFKRETIQRFMGYFKRLVSSLVQAPGMKLSDIEIIAPEEKEQLLVNFNDTLRDYPGNKRIDQPVKFSDLGIESGEIADQGVIDEATGEPVETFVAPRDDVEEKLAGIWSEILYPKVSKTAIGIDDNFFEVGGHSLSTVLMTSQILEELGVDVPPVEVLKTPFIRQLAEFIKNSGTLEIKGNHRDIVLLGKEYPEAKSFFLVHDGSGKVEGYVKFCKHLDIPVNCRGIQAPELENYTPENRSIETIAQSYIRKIREVQPEGPYFIGGWSLGGTIAFEIVRQLEQQDQEIAFAALFDSPPPASRWQDNGEPFSIESEVNFIKKYISGSDVEEKLESVTDIGAVWPLVVNYLEENQFDPGIIRKVIVDYEAHVVPNYDQLGVRQLIHYLNTGRALSKARALYVPTGKLHTPVHYFAASQSKGIINHEVWNRYCQKSVKFRQIDGDHYSIFEMPHVAEFGAKFCKLF